MSEQTTQARASSQTQARVTDEDLQTIEREKMGPERVRAIRMGLDMTLKEAAHRVGCTLNNFSRWERSRDKPSACRPNMSAVVVLKQMEAEVKSRRLRSYHAVKK